MITHDLGLAWNIADRVAVMYLGRLVEVGPVEQVLTSPQHPYTQALLSVLSDSEEPTVLVGEPPDSTRVPGGCRFHPRCPLLAAGLPEDMARRCRGEDVVPIRTDAQDVEVACHVVAARPAR